MTIEEAVKEFGSGRQICLALGLTVQNYTKWNKQGFIPQSQQLRLEKLTNGKLKADEFGSNRRPINLE